jgi:hypothetical protein
MMAGTCASGGRTSSNETEQVLPSANGGFPTPCRRLLKSGRRLLKSGRRLLKSGNISTENSCKKQKRSTGINP